MYAEFGTCPVARRLHIECNRAPVCDEPAEKQTGEFPSARADYLCRPTSARPHEPERVIDVITLPRVAADIADATRGEQHVICGAASADRYLHPGLPTLTPNDDRPQRATQARQAPEALGNCGPVALGRQRDDRQAGGDRARCGYGDDREPRRRRPLQLGVDPGDRGSKVRGKVASLWMTVGPVDLHRPELHVVARHRAVAEIVAPVEDSPTVG